MQRTQIYLPRTQLLAVKEVARRQDTTTSEVIRKLIQQYVQTNAQDKKRAKTNKSFFSQTKSVIKKINRIGEKGPMDLAKNMDRYLYGDI
ncbi:MAG: ribbon-helix-helix protein, CopG family [Patescibacteria group bacterium]